MQLKIVGIELSKCDQTNVQVNTIVSKKSFMISHIHIKALLEEYYFDIAKPNIPASFYWAQWLYRLQVTFTCMILKYTDVKSINYNCEAHWRRSVGWVGYVNMTWSLNWTNYFTIHCYGGQQTLWRKTSKINKIRHYTFKNIFK